MPSDMPKEMLFDSRIRERNIRKGLIAQKDADQYLEALPDLSSQAVAIEARFENTAQEPGGRAASITAATPEEEEID